jgi:hypothetical protein
MAWVSRGSRVVVVLLVGPAWACSPGRIAGQEGADDGSSSGATEESGFDGGPPDLADPDTGGDPPWGGCKHEGPMAYLDICEPEDPCDAVDCPVCLGGLCVAPAPAELCEDVVLTELGITLAGANASVWVDLDGQPGDELVRVSGTAFGWSVQVYIDGAEVVSEFSGSTYPSSVTALRYDDDGVLDLLVTQATNTPGHVHLLIGDGEGGFMLAPPQFASVAPLSPIVLDFDGDGADDLFAYLPAAKLSAVYRNLGAEFELVDTLMVDGRRSSVADVDGDGARDDVLLGNYPSPDLLLGDGSGLVYAEALPSAERGPGLEYGLGRPLATDLDGDGWIDVLSLIEDNHGRSGIRIWAGIGPGQFAEPVDQLIVDLGWAVGYGVELIGVAELDGTAPPELLLVIDDDELVYARPNLDTGPPVTCLGSLVEGVAGLPSVGDLDADGWPELAIQTDELRVYTTLP